MAADPYSSIIESGLSLAGRLGLFGEDPDARARRQALATLRGGTVSGDLQKLYANFASNPELEAAVAAGVPALRAAAAGQETPEQQYQRAQDEARVAEANRGAIQAQENLQRRTGARTAGQALALGRMGTLQAGTQASQLGLQRLAQRGQAQREAQGMASNLATSELGRQGTVRNAQASALQQRWNEANAMANLQAGGNPAAGAQRQAGVGAGVGSMVGGLLNLIPSSPTPRFSIQNAQDPRVDPNTGWVD